MRIFKNRWFEKFTRKQDIPDSALVEAVDRAARGLVDADLGGGVLKQRVTREGEVSPEDIGRSSFSAPASGQCSCSASRRTIAQN